MYTVGRERFLYTPRLLLTSVRSEARHVRPEADTLHPPESRRVEAPATHVGSFYAA